MNEPSIINKKYYNIDDAINSCIESKNVFIIANERLTKSGYVGRYFTVFPNIDIFLVNRDQYKHSHEILVDHKNNKKDVKGRLVFDFDIKKKTDDVETVIPGDFKKQIEKTIIFVIKQYFYDVDIEIIEFIWSSSQNPNKFSKHLTVKNVYFDDWIIMSKFFYKLFCLRWDNKFDWINSRELIDYQIVRNRASLRMVGSMKINGYPLIFDDDKHVLTDSLIRVYQKHQRKKEQLITQNNINNGVLDDMLIDFRASKQIPNMISKSVKIMRPLYDPIVYQHAFNVYDSIIPGIFRMGKINQELLSLIRIKPYKCLLSGKIHEAENAFMVINKGEKKIYH